MSHTHSGYSEHCPSRNDKKIALMFGNIARYYDFLNHFLSLGMDIYWRKKLVEQVDIDKQKRILDLAAGTQDVAKILCRKFSHCRVFAADFSLPMLTRGLQKDPGRRIVSICADAKTLPFPEKSFDCITIAFGIRNLSPRSSVYKEILRLLAPGGKLCILEFGSGKNKIWGGVYNFYLSKVLPCLGKIISRDATAYSYLAITIQKFPDPKELEKELAQAGFNMIEHLPISSGIVYIHTAKKPCS